MTTLEDWEALERACWNHEAGEVRIDGYLLRRLMNEARALRQEVIEMAADRHADMSRLDYMDRPECVVDAVTGCYWKLDADATFRDAIDAVAIEREEATWLAK